MDLGIVKHASLGPESGVFGTAQVLISRLGKLWTGECVQWLTDARGVRIIWSY
jgi:hypothetical protein